MKSEIKSLDSFNKFCTSLQVAKKFKRTHRDILKSIRRLILRDNIDDNFLLSSYICCNNSRQPMYLMTYKGFIQLINSFTGENAFIIREAIFNVIDNFIADTKEEA